MNHEDTGPPRRPGRPAHPVSREHLLKVASEAFSQLGYAGASMGDIAERSGIRKSSLFHHFATKDELYRDVLVMIVGDITALVHQTMDGEEPFLLRLERGTRAVQRFFGERPVAARLLMRELVDGAAGAAGAAEAIDLVMNRVAGALEGGMDDGSIPRQDPKQLVMSLAGVQFLYFAVPEVSARFVGSDIFAEENIELRAQLACAHVRRLVGA